MIFLFDHLLFILEVNVFAIACLFVCSKNITFTIMMRMLVCLLLKVDIAFATMMRVFLEMLFLSLRHACLFVCFLRCYVYHHNTHGSMFIFNHHCFCHDCFWLVILVVCLGIVVVENNKLGIVGNMHAYLFVVYSQSWWFWHHLWLVITIFWGVMIVEGNNFYKLVGCKKMTTR